MEYVFVQGADQSAPTFLLLHGTGGNEKDLLNLGQTLNEKASLLGVRGAETENGMPRFFKRLGMGVFDLENLSMRTAELAKFIDEAAVKHQFNRDNVIAVGYSNGANIAANLFFEIGKVVKGAILYHPMVPRTDVVLPDLAGTKIFIGAGRNDQMCPAEQSINLQSYLKDAGAEVDVYWHDYGHQITSDEVEASKTWFNKQFK